MRMYVMRLRTMWSRVLSRNDRGVRWTGRTEVLAFTMFVSCNRCHDYMHDTASLALHNKCMHACMHA